MKVIEINNIDDLFSYLESIHNHFYFRGYNGEYAWYMRPGLGRKNDKLVKDEIEIIQKFVKIPALKDLKIIIGNLHELLELGQHYGLPTRLLDWTTNPFVALYFALGEIPYDDSCMSIALISNDNPDITNSWLEIDDIAKTKPTLGEMDPKTLDDLAYTKINDLDDFNLFKTKVTHPLFADKYHKGIEAMSDKMLIKYHATDFNEKIIRQEGLFTIHKEVNEAISESLVDYLIKINFDKSTKTKVAERLDEDYRINRCETICDPKEGTPLFQVKKWCENIKNSYKNDR
jgi:hypothetical protein